MYCKGCGRKLKEGAQFCGGCGKKVQMQEQKASEALNMPVIAPILCAGCGSQLRTGVKFCTRCGLKTGEMPKVIKKNNRPKPRKTASVVLSVIVTIVLVIIAGAYIEPYIKPYIESGFNNLPGKDKGSSFTENNTQDASTDTRKVDKVEIEKGVKDIENAFKAKDVEQIAKLVHPQMAQNYKAAFEKHKEELDKIATLIESRKPVALYVDYAEYEVNDGSGTYEMIFEKYNGIWVLSSF